MDTGLVIKLYENNSLGLSTPEIAKIYEDEYGKQKDKKDNDLPEKIKNNIFLGLGWGWAYGKLNQTLPNYVPILLELHRLNYADPTTLNQEYLQKQLVEAFERDDFPNAQRFVVQGLENGTLVIFLDGLDEVNSNLRPLVIKEIKDLLDKYDKCRVIITCRTAVYNNEFAEEVEQTLDIVDFTDQQIRRFFLLRKGKIWQEQLG